MKSFDDVVNEEFLEKYSDKIKEEYMPVDKNGKISFDRMRGMFKSLHGYEYPYRFTYAVIHGYQNLIDSWSLPSQFRGKEEQIYKMCLEKDTDWKELFGHKTEKGVLL